MEKKPLENEIEVEGTELPTRIVWERRTPTTTPSDKTAKRTPGE